MKRNLALILVGVFAWQSANAGKLEVPDDLKYPNIIPPLHEIGGFGSDLAGRISEIQDIAFAPDGSLIVSDGASRTLLRLDMDGRILASSVNTGASALLLGKPKGIHLTEAGALYVVDAARRRLHEVDLDFRPRKAIEIAETVDPYDVAVLDGRAYITDNTANRVQVYDLAEGRHLGSLAPQADGEGLSLPLGIDRHEGKLVVADSGNNRILVMKSDGDVVEHWGGWGSYGGQLATPYNVATHEGVVLVADQINHRLQAFSLQGEFQYQWARHPPTAHEGEGRVHYPSTIAVNKEGTRVAVCEVIESRCQIFGELTTSGQIAKVSDSAWWEKATRFHYGARPTMSGGVLAVSEPDTHSVLIFKLEEARGGGLAPQFITRVGGQGRKFGQMVQPSGILVDADAQRLWVSDRGNLRMQQFAFSEKPARKSSNKDKPITKLSDGYGSHKFVRAIDLGPQAAMAKNAKAKAPISQRQVGEPSAMALHPRGDVYMIDPALGQVHVMDKDMSLKRTFGRYGMADDELLKPLGIAISPNGKRVYVVDEYAFKVKVFSPEGAYLSSWGGPGTAPGQFVTPFGIAVSSKGDVFVSDTAKNEIKKFTADGKFVMSFGAWGAGPGEFYKPKGIAFDAKDRLVVMDFGNHRGQVFDTDGKFLSMFGISENPSEVSRAP